ncbi:MAG: tripartite tricarboxylate transporter substrate binding protein [Burkholderiales bacterium]|nr:tripartite tricarboxylate transporter substrate binding protein [Burkholderiales bacterium]
MSTVRALAVSSILTAVACAPALAQTFPSKPVRIVVPYPAGGSGTIIARILGDRLNQAWGQQILVDSRPGASGMIGAEIVAKAPPDGYTLLAGYTSEVAINISLFPKMAYDPRKDFAPIALTGIVPMILLVHPSVPAKSVNELMALARSRPGEMTYASAGAGSPAHLAHELLNGSAKVKMVHVPYKGAAPALVDLLGGHVFTYFSGMPPAMPHVRAGRLRGLAVSTAKRSAAAPDIPAVAESVPGFDVPTWFSLLAPVGTPPDIVVKINAETVRGLNDPAVKPKLAALGAETTTMTADDVSAFIRKEIEKFARVVKASGARVE